MTDYREKYEELKKLSEGLIENIEASVPFKDLKAALVPPRPSRSEIADELEGIATIFAYEHQRDIINHAIYELRLKDKEDKTDDRA